MPLDLLLLMVSEKNDKIIKDKGFRTSVSGNVTLFYFTISKNYFITHTILFYNTFSIPKLYFY